MLIAPGSSLLLVAVKFTSGNTYVNPGEGRKSPISLTHAEVRTATTTWN